MIITTITDSLKALVTNRYLTVLTVVTLLLAVLFVGYIFLTVHPSELQLVTHYTAYGVTHLYRDQWFYLFGFAGFGLLVGLLHIAIAIKLFLTKGHPLAIMFAWMGIGVILFAWIVSASILDIWKP